MERVVTPPDTERKRPSLRPPPREMQAPERGNDEIKREPPHRERGKRDYKTR